MSAELNLGFTRRSRVRLIRQTEVTECGLASLAMVANYHGVEVDLGTLRRWFAPSLRGAALNTLIATADELGFTSRAVKLPLEEIGNLHMPALLHWDMNHYVVLERVEGGSSGAGKALIHDPAGRSKWYGFDELSKHFTGVALELRPADDFKPAKLRERLKLSQLWQRMTGLKRALLQTLVLSVVMQAFVLASPYYMQVAIDRALPALDNDLLTVLALGFGLFTLVNVAASLLRSFVLLSAGTSLSFGVAANIARRLFRLPISWFEKRHVGDVLSRFQSIAPIQQALTQGAVAALIDGLLAVLILGVMFFYSAALTLLALAAFALYALVLFGLLAGSAAWLVVDKSVRLTVDGEAQAVSTYASTVAGVLDDAGLTVSPRDVLAPAAEARISDGAEIVLRRGYGSGARTTSDYFMAVMRANFRVDVMAEPHPLGQPSALVPAALVMRAKKLGV